MSENFSKTLNDSLTDTTSHFNSRSTSRSHGTSFGFLGIGFNNSTSTGYSSGSSWASAVTRGTSETKGETVTETDTDTTGDSRTITVTSENKSVKYILEKIDQHLARIKNCEAFGLWDIACYFVSENVQTSVVAASTYKALMVGLIPALKTLTSTCGNKITRRILLPSWNTCVTAFILVFLSLEMTSFLRLKARQLILAA